MKAVYNAQSMLDARIVADELWHNGIHAEIFGGHLQGGMGELPASGLVRVMVGEDDLDRAARIVAEWERTTTERTNEQLSASHRGRSLAGFALGLMTGIAGTWLFFSLPEPARDTLYFDYNNDRQPDAWVEQVAGQPRVRRRDRDFDGRVDALWRFDERGRLTEGRFDDDFDGRMELQVEFARQLRHRGEVDANDDGLPEMTFFYRHGILREKHLHDPDTGGVVERHHYRAGRRLQRIEYDSNGDGVLDASIKLHGLLRPVSARH